MQTAEVFNALKQLCEADPKGLGGIAISCIWHVVEDGTESRWLIDLKNRATVTLLAPGASAPRTDVQLRSAAELTSLLARGEVSPQEAFLAGDLKVAGNLAGTLSLNYLFERLVESLGAGKSNFGKPGTGN